MTEPPRRAADRDDRLQHCIRDLAALNALPSMCVGRSPEEVLTVILDALPVALSCELIYLSLPGPQPTERACLNGALLSEPALAELRAALGGDAEKPASRSIPGIGELWLFEAVLPIGAERGRFVAGRRSPLDPETDRVLLRSAANLAGSTLEAANVLDSARRKDEFLAVLGHELRNPLAPIVTAVELLARHPAAARERQVIHRHARHLVRLVDDLLDISRVTSGHVELRNEQVTLASVLERAIEIAGPLAAKHRHSLELGRADGITLQGDPVRLAQVFGNLLTNAAKFTPPGGKISVKIEPAPERVRVTVRDNGRGIAREEMTRIFQPFVQSDRRGDALSGGLGLGLAIVSSLVHRHGGTISVESAGRGHGSAFTVELPRVVHAAPVVELAAPQPATARSGVRVLVVDDNVDIAELLSESLEYEGFRTARAHDARAALERWQTFAPHAAVLDLGLPELDGYELAKTLRAQHGSAPMLIAATGYGQQKDRVRAADAGFDCHFVKPVSVQDLVQVLDQRIATTLLPH